MPMLNIVIADSDELYLNSLTNYIIEKTKTFESSVFSLKESLVKYVQNSTNKIDILLVNKNFVCDEICNSDIKVKLLLAENSEEVDGFLSIKKYQKTESLIREILILYAECTGETNTIKGNKNTKLVGFYSPIGGSGKTTLALSTALTYSNYGLKTFYLNLERIDSTSGLFSRTNGTMSDIFLALKAKGGNAGLKILNSKGIEPSTNLHYISGIESISEYDEIDSKDIIALFDTFEKLCEYDIVIVDFDSSFNSEKLKILECCDHIITPMTADPTCVKRMQMLFNESNLHSMFDHIFKKMHLIVNKADLTSSNHVLQSSELLNSKAIEMMIAMSPVFLDIQNLVNMRASLYPILNPILDIIQ
jgi:cellulose biosynthesis protein BcsQ